MKPNGQESVDLISDEEVLEVREASASQPPPLPELSVEAWQPRSFEEMLQTQGLKAPRPPTQTEPEDRIRYLREQIRHLEQRDQAARAAWEIIQSQGEEMEHQATGIKGAHDRQQIELKAIETQLAETTKAFTDYKETAASVFDEKDSTESSLQAGIEQKTDEVKHLRTALDSAKRERNETRAQADAEQAKRSEESADLIRAHDSALLELDANHTELILDLNAAHEAAHAEQKSAQETERRTQEFFQRAQVLELKQEQKEKIAIHEQLLSQAQGKSLRTQLVQNHLIERLDIIKAETAKLMAQNQALNIQLKTSAQTQREQALGLSRKVGVEAKLKQLQSVIVEKETTIEELRAGMLELEAARKADFEKAQKQNKALAKKTAALQVAEAKLQEFHLEVAKSAADTEKEISDLQESIFAKLEETARLRDQLGKAENTQTNQASEKGNIEARLKGAILRIDELETQIFESETLRQTQSLELERVIAERNYIRAELRVRDSQLPETDKPHLAASDAPFEEESTIDLDDPRVGRLNRVLRQAEVTIQRELERRQDFDIGTPGSGMYEAQETKVQEELPQAVLDAAARLRAESAGTEFEGIEFIPDDAIIEIDAIEPGVEDAEEDTLGPHGIEEPIEEETSPFGQLMSQLGDLPHKKHFVRRPISDPLAALQALEYSAGLIHSPRDQDPFIDISNQGEEKITDVRHEDELDS